MSFRRRSGPVTAWLLFVAIIGCHGEAIGAQLTLTWVDNSTGETGFSVERSTGTSGSFAEIGTTSGAITAYTDPTLADATTYCYRVRAFSATAYSDYSNVACGTTAASVVALAVATMGDGAGTVISTPSGIICGTTCSASYPSGSTVTLTAAPATGSTFTGWSGGGCSGTDACTVVLSAETTVTATFALSSVSLGVSKAGTGTGTVSSTPAGIMCGTICSGTYAGGTTISLTAAPATGSRFTGWSGGGCSGAGSCTVTLGSDTTVTAAFTLQSVTLSVGISGNGGGTVSSNPAGIACGPTCSASYPIGTAVTLTATPASGVEFTGWSGGGCAGAGPCTLTLTASTAVMATFGAQSGNPALMAAVLPSARSVQVGTPATAFVAVLNSGTSTAHDVVMSLDTPIPAAFSYQRTDPATNQPTGVANTPVDIPPHQVQTYVIGITPAASFDPTDVVLKVGGSDTAPVTTLVGINTLLLSASMTPVPDIVAMAVTLTQDGIVRLPGSDGTSAFAVATVNLGTTGTITASADTGTAALPVSISVCATDSSTGACISAIGSSVTMEISNGNTPAFGIFVTGTATVPFDPARNRIFVRFTDSVGATRGETSVAVQTQ